MRKPAYRRGELKALAEFAQNNDIALTLLAPAPLVEGVVDLLNLKVCPSLPTQAAAELEGSKVFTKDFLARHNIPTALIRTSLKLSRLWLTARRCAPWWSRPTV